MVSTPSPKLSASLGRQPSLDGIRGLAILAVVVFHFGWSWLPGGFLGVDIFFALSGFLITTLLLEEQFALGEISLRRFFTRRGIRLYPALVALVAVSTAYTLLFHRETSAARAGAIALWVLGYGANWATMFDGNAWFSGMPHTWSLAVEVHFYILWAVIIALAAKKFSQPADRARLLQTLAWIAGGIALASIAWRAVLSAQGAPWLRMYLGTDTRLDAVFVGALSALARLHLLGSPSPRWPVSVGRAAVSTVETLCALVIGLLLVFLPWQTALPGKVAFTVASLATAVLILTTTLRTDTLFGVVLRTPVMTWFGRISYSIYIWHVPAAKFASSERLVAHGVPPLAAECFRLVATIIVGLISYHLIERTFLRLKNRFEPQIPPGSTPKATAS